MSDREVSTQLTRENQNLLDGVSWLQTNAYMQKYPDTLLLGECSPYFYYDKQDIDMVASKPFRSDWHYMTKSHISPLADDLYAQWRGKW